jgi:hypothetical protein
VLSLASKRFLGIDFPRGRDLGPVLVVWLLSLMVLVFEKDLGTSLMYFGMFVVTLYIATERASWLIIGLLLFFGGAFLACVAGASIGGPFANFYARVDVWLTRSPTPTDDRLPDGPVAARARHRRLFGPAGHGLPYLPTLAGTWCPRCTTTSSSPARRGDRAVRTHRAAGRYLLIVQRGLRSRVTVRGLVRQAARRRPGLHARAAVFVIIGGVTG